PQTGPFIFRSERVRANGPRKRRRVGDGIHDVPGGIFEADRVAGVTQLAVPWTEDLAAAQSVGCDGREPHRIFRDDNKATSRRNGLVWEIEGNTAGKLPARERNIVHV